eukprot:m.32158 g.32158  ORF g.32158 m.32158 type:complete len:468 (+) comp14916_c0_seq2:68-1471(+)
MSDYINIAVGGPRHAGKSELVSSLLCFCGLPNEPPFKQYARDDWPKYREEWRGRVFRDTEQYDREFHTYNTELEGRDITLVDTPSPDLYMKNVISGFCMAHALVYVVDATASEEELPDHDVLACAYTFGIKQLIIVVSKMEATSPPYSQKVFQELSEKITAMANKVGYSNKLAVIPVSVFENQNIAGKSDKLPWFTGWTWKLRKNANELSGHTLLEALQATNINLTDKSTAPLRIPILNRYLIKGVGSVVTGTVMSGVLEVGTEVSIACNRGYATATAASIELSRRSVSAARPGMFVGIHLKGLQYHGTDATHVKDIPRGATVCSTATFEGSVQQFEAQVILLGSPKDFPSFRLGFTPTVYCQGAGKSCRVTQILSKIDRRSGATLEVEPIRLKHGEAGRVVFTLPHGNLPVEPFSAFPPLGRIFLRDNNRTVGVGVVKSVTHDKAQVAQVVKPKKTGGLTKSAMKS